MYYSYDDFLKDLVLLQNKVEQDMGIPDALVCIARGGMTMTHMLGLAWNLRSVYSLNAISYSDNKVQSSLILENMPIIKPEHKKILVLDEIIDSGNSLSVVMQKLRANFSESSFSTAVIFQKPSAKVIADYYIREAGEWIDFFWEVDMLRDNAKNG